MSENISILKLMTKDHGKIDILLEKLDEKSKENFSEMKKAFHNFEWELEKHIFTEERAIFTDYDPEDVREGYKMLPELTKQHNYIVNVLNNWRNDVKSNKIPKDIYGFKEFLRKHREFEEQDVYPKLDDALNKEEKENIFAKINEIIQR